MKQYLLLIHDNSTSDSTADEWQRFFVAAKDSGFFRGGSEIGEHTLLGKNQSVSSSRHIVGYMRFDADEKSKLLSLLNSHPTVLHGGTIELCELPKS
ncbi:MAG TPA: hypothetical protein PKD68_05375 [Candidatus Saccharibacteria bacterium]|nr:hypothetical protein [Candidatus Saccharibacteria bacterium]